VTTALLNNSLGSEQYRVMNRFMIEASMSPQLSTWRCRGPVALNQEREMEAMVLSASEESLIEVVRMLPPDEASKVLVWRSSLRISGADGALTGRTPGRTTIFGRLHSHLSSGLNGRSRKGVEAQYCSLKVLVCWGTRGLSRVCSG
jgi:hypothetical protein